MIDRPGKERLLVDKPYRFKHRFIGLAIILCFILATTSIGIAKNGRLPNGKPFQIIQGQLDDVHTQIDAIDESIINLQTQITELVFDTSNLLDRIIVNEQFIADFKVEIADIKEQLALLVSASKAQGKEIDINSDEIQKLILQHQIATAKISYLEKQNTDLQIEVDGKQEPLLGNCPEGTAIRDIAPDGTITCESIPTPAPTGYSSVRSSYRYYSAQLPKSDRDCELGVIVELPFGGGEIETCLDWSDWSTPNKWIRTDCSVGWIRAGGGFSIALMVGR